MCLQRLLFSLLVLAIYAFIYIPVVVLIIFSFNDAALSYAWKGFSLRWYQDLLVSVEVWHALKNSLLVAFSSVVLSIVLGMSFVYHATRNKWSRSFVLFYGSLAIPEIVLAVGLLSLFSLLGAPLGRTTLIVAHTLLGLGYVIPIIQTRFALLNERFTEAALDLGASEKKAFFTVLLPLLAPALMAAALLVFIISLDDFVISFFCSGGSTQTLPMYIFSMIRSGATPVVNALSTVLLGVSSFIILLLSLLNVKKMDLVK